MTNPSRNRWAVAIGCGLAVVLVQFVALAAISYSAWDELIAPDTPCLKMAFAPYATFFHGKLYYSLGKLQIATNGLNAAGTDLLGSMDLKTGRVIERQTESMSFGHGLVASNHNLWNVGDREVLETDGATQTLYHPKRILVAGANRAFLYEGRPAVVEQDAQQNYHLLVFGEGEWEERGRLAFPGPHRSTVVDQQTGESVLIPRTSATEDDNQNSVNLYEMIFWAGGRWHLFQSDTQTAYYRTGFDFVESSTDRPASAMAPENAPADTTSWIKLDSRLAGFSPYRPFQALNDRLYFSMDNGIYRVSVAEPLNSHSEIEFVAPYHRDRKTSDVEVFDLTLLADTNSNQIYLLEMSEFADIELSSVRDGRLQKLPYHVAGIFEPLKRWFVGLVIQGMAILMIGAIVLVLVMGGMSQQSEYCFGHESVLLAPLGRRSLARFVDLSIIFGPSIVLMLWYIWHSTGPSILEESRKNQNIWMTLLPDITWISIIWLAMLLTSAKWGVTVGKWLFGIRVVRSTLRPCGFFPSLVRELLLGIDVPQMVTPAPGLVLQMVTANRQRLGDLIAGTIVVDVNRLRVKA